MYKSKTADTKVLRAKPTDDSGRLLWVFAFLALAACEADDDSTDQDTDTNNNGGGGNTDSNTVSIAIVDNSASFELGLAGKTDPVEVSLMNFISGDTTSFSYAITNSANAADFSVGLNAAGTAVTITPTAAAVAGVYAFTLIATSPSGVAESTVISYTIEADDAIHGPPTSEAERGIGANESLDLTEIFTGGNGAFTYSLLNETVPTGFALAADGTSVEIDTAAVGEGAYLLTVQAKDTDGDTLNQEVTVLLVNYEPSATNVALDDSLTLNASIKRINFADAEIAPITIAGLFSGGDGTLTYTLKRDPANADEPDIFTLSSDNTKVVIDSTKTAAVLEGNNVVTLVATDTDGDTAEQVITVTLTNLAPDAVDVSQDPMLSLTAAIERSDYAAAEIAPIAIAGLFAGGDGALTYSLKFDPSATDQPDVFALSSDKTQVVINSTKTAAVLEGDNVVTLVATDEDGDTAEQVITVTLNDLLLKALTPAESGYMSTIQQIDTGNYGDTQIAPFALETLFTPGDGEIVYELQGNENSLFKINAGTHVVIDPDKTSIAEIGANTVTVVATDIDGDTGQHILTVSISVKNDNDLVPMALDVADNLKQATFVRSNFADTDIAAITIAGLFSGGDEPLSYGLVRDSSAIDQPDLFKLNVAGTSVVIDPNKTGNAREGDNVVTVVATDTDGDSAMQVLTVTLNDLTPTAESGGAQSTSFTRSAFASTEIAPITIAGLFSGGDPTLTYSLERDSSQVNEPNAFVIDAAQAKVIIDSTKTANVLEGENYITLVATDIDGDRATQHLTFSLTDLVPTALTNAAIQTAIDDANFENAATLEEVVQLSTSGFFSGGDGTLAYSLAGTDKNNDGIYDGIFVLSADNATLRVAGDRLTELAIGENTVVVVATDSDGDAVMQVVTVDVADLDPRALLTPKAIDLRITDGIQNVAIDWFVGGTSSVPLTYSLNNADGSAYEGDVFAIDSGSLRIAANNLGGGANTVKVVASVGSDSAEVSFTVNALFASVAAGEMFALTSSLSALGAFSHIGDVNNDGYGDVIIGAPASSGRTYVVWGGEEIITANIDLDNMSAEQGFVISGGNNNLGHAVKGGGDVNGDGIGDILVGADSGIGAAYLIWGTEGTRADLNLSNLAASEGFEILGENSGDRLGHGASLSGDYNNDGYADIVLGARFADPNGVSQAGKSYVIWGHSGDFGTIDGASRTIDLSTMTKTEGFILESNGNADYAGFSVDGSADFNGDGLDDLVIGVFCDSVAHTWAGETLILWGRTDGGYGVDKTKNGVEQRILNVNDLRINDGISFKGDDAFDKLGVSVAGVGDLNGDGYGEIIFASQANDDGGTQAKSGFTNGSGVAYVIWGRAITPDSNAAKTLTTLDMSKLSPEDGFVFEGVGTSTKFGGTVSSAGDLNNDGFMDLAIGAIGDTITDGSSTLSGAGAVYVVWGSNTTEYGTLEDNTDSGGGFERRVLRTSELDATALATRIHAGASSGAGIGDSVAGGDINGDGFSDLVIGAGSANAVVIYGGDDWRLQDTGLVANPAPAVDLTAIHALSSGELVVHVGDLFLGGDGLLSYAYKDAAEQEITSNIPYSYHRGTGNLTIDVDDIANGAYEFTLIATDSDDDMAEVVISGYISPLDSIAINASSLGTAGLVLSGTSNSRFGKAVAAVGDIDNDGDDDLAIGAFKTSDTGKAYLLEGRGGETNTRAFTLSDASELNGKSGVTQYLGNAVSGLGDANGDGIDDFVIGDYWGHDGGHWSGDAYVVFGTSAGLPSALDLTAGNTAGDLQPAVGFVIRGDKAYDDLGYSVANAGDIDGDGTNDIVVGAAGVDGGSTIAGYAVVIWGRSDSSFGTTTADNANGRQVIDISTLATAEGFAIAGTADNDQFGQAVSTAGDLDNDGHADLLIASASGNGEVHVIWGSATRSEIGTAAIADLTATTGVTINGGSGSNSGDNLGVSLADLGDVNGDGYDDIVLGSDADAAYIVYGQANKQLGTESIDGSGENAKTIRTLDVGALTAKQGVRLHGTASDGTGALVQGIGDINYDGMADLAVAAADNVYIVWGSATMGSALDLTALQAHEGITLNATGSVSALDAADLDADGYDDLIIGNGSDDEVSIVWGSTDWFHNRLHTQANNTFDLAQDVGATDYVLDLSTLVRGGTGTIEYGFTAGGGHDAATIDGSVLTVDANASGFALTFTVSDAIDEYQWSLGIS